MGRGAIPVVGVLIAPLVAAVGLLTATGTIGLVQRNEPVKLILGLLLVVLAGGLWFASAQVPKRKATWILRVIALGASVAGFGLAVWAPSTPRAARRDLKSRLA